MIRRNITGRVLAALQDTPVVLLHGARQTGKTTLVRSCLDEGLQARYVTFDDMAVLAAAQADPQSFLAQFAAGAVIDEVQRLPELALAIKASVDRDRRPGRFLLTGSANVLQVPRLADSLVGRTEILTLWPFSQGEIAGVRDDFVSTLFATDVPAVDAFSRTAGLPLIERICRGGYPEVQERATDDRRHAWFTSYVATILQRDVRDLSNIEGLTAVPRLLALLATRTGALLNVADIARSVQIPQTTLKRYLALLEQTFLVQRLAPWSTSLGLRLVKSPKLYLSDTGLLVHLLDMDQARLRADPTQLGRVVENLVVTEIRKQLTWSPTRAQLYHLRTQTGVEVDVLLEGRGGRIVGVEVKATAAIEPGHFSGLRRLAEAVGPKFLRGVVLYAGADVLPFGDRMWAVPLGALWRGGPDAMLP
jgi:predicted AAA+ superfamily ATPase